MSGGLAPSKSTVYVSNLPFSLTNNDLHKLFSKYGKVVKVTIVKDKVTRLSKGVAFVLFLDRESAFNCTRAINSKQLFGRTVKASIAIDNGRAPEFIRRRNYTDKSQCYECGDCGHLSYACPKNVLGEREPPKKKEKKKKKRKDEEPTYEEEESEEEGEDPALDSLSQAIAFQQAKVEEEEKRRRPGGGEEGGEGRGEGRGGSGGSRGGVEGGGGGGGGGGEGGEGEGCSEASTSEEHKPRIKKSTYFSDEEELSD